MNISKGPAPVRSFSVAAQNTTPHDIFFSADGIRMYVVGSSNNSIYEYSLGTAWNVSSSAFVRSYNVTAQETNPTSVFFRPDGSRMYVVGTASDRVHEYSLSSAWNVSTASFVRNFSVSSQETNPTSVFFRPDGLRMYVVGTASDRVHEYSLSSAWNVSTAAFVRNFGVGQQEATPNGLFFGDDGASMYVVGTSGDRVNEYSLASPWNLSTATFSRSFSVVSEEKEATGIFMSPDGLRMYIIGSDSDSVHEYSLGSAWSVRSYSQSLNLAVQETLPQDLFFKADGTRMYVVGFANDSVYEYALGSAWDIGSASFARSFGVGPQETVPTGLSFRPDGYRMYVVGSDSDRIHEYSLGVAWDVTTASALGNFSVALQEASPQGLFLREDGLRAYVIGSASDSVHEYSLGSAWSVSTASFSRSFSVAAQETSPTGIFFRPDGYRMYVVGTASNSVHEYVLGSAWDVSTASHRATSAETRGSDTLVMGLFFRGDGLRMYISGDSSNRVYEYSWVSPSP